MADRGYVPRPVPGGPHAKELAHRRQLAGHGETANRRDVDANEIYEPVADEGHVLGLIDK